MIVFVFVAFLFPFLLHACTFSAKRRGVFKIETIGDCYVAVTGIPDPQIDHAIVMVKFAFDMIEKLDDELHRLATILGMETLGLAMRVGIHSGPVTAGVLRGEKARFQLFGDSVNTTARIESSGKPNRIHASEATANLLIQAGKGHWVKERDDRIVAKGKGEMKTFWIEPKINHNLTEDQIDLNHSSDLLGTEQYMERIDPTTLDGFDCMSNVLANHPRDHSEDGTALEESPTTSMPN